jgi:hypothetical protein
MHEPDFWTNCAEAVELSIEGNRLIARELSEALRHVWQRVSQSFDMYWHGQGPRRQA